MRLAREDGFATRAVMRHWAWFPTGRGDAALQRIDLVDGRSSANQRLLRRQGLAGWQSETTAGLLAAWELTAKPGVFFDVGSNAGVYSLLCRLLWPSIEAVAFEPSPATLNAGLRWAAANDVTILFEQMALSDTGGSASLYLSSKSDASNSLVEGFRRATGTLTVDIATLDGYVDAEDLVPTVMKVDVEQHELAVIRGAEKTLEQHRPVVIMEQLKTADAQEAQKRLRGLGYRPHRLGSRDRLYWPGRLPAAWDAAFAGWLQAVKRCRPAGRG